MTPARVALLVPQDLGYGRGVLAGIQAWATERGGWQLRHAPPTADALGPLRAWRPDGVVAHLADAAVAGRLKRMKAPVVNTTSTLTSWRGPLAEVDHAAVGRMAAEHLLGLGLRHFGYLGSGWAGFSLERERAFAARLAEAGRAASVCHLNYLPQPPSDRPWGRVDADLRAWLAALPKPCGVMASNDRPGRELVDACRQLGVAVLGEVAVVGVDNDEFECRMCDPPLSSVANPAEAVGRAAAEMLAALMAGRPADTRVRLAPPRVVPRGSSDAVAVADPVARAILGRIRDDSTRGLTAAEAVAGAGCSRRQAERRFRAACGRSVLEAITAARVARARPLLAETNLDPAAVAREAGFGSPRRMAEALRA